MFGAHFWLFSIEFDTFRTFQYLGFVADGIFFYLKSEKSGITFGQFFLLFLTICIAGPIGGSMLSMAEFGGSFAILENGENGTTVAGGYLLALALTVLLAKILKLKALKVLDLSTLAYLFAYGFGKLGCFFSGDGCYGILTNSWMGMTFPNGIIPTTVPVYPAPLFELICAETIFGIFYYLSTRPRNVSVPAGRIFFTATSWMVVCRFTIEFIRLNPKYAGFTLTQWISIPMLLGLTIGNFRLPLTIPSLNGGDIPKSELIPVFSE